MVPYDYLVVVPEIVQHIGLEHYQKWLRIEASGDPAVTLASFIKVGATFLTEKYPFWLHFA